MDKARFFGTAPVLVVTDVRKTAEYYRDILGFTIIGLVGDLPVYGMVGRDGFQVHFAKSDSQAIPINKAYRSISPDFIIWVPEIDQFFEELTTRNATILEGIVQRPYGSREFLIEDCDGHRILIGN